MADLTQFLKAFGELPVVYLAFATFFAILAFAAFCVHVVHSVAKHNSKK